MIFDKILNHQSAGSASVSGGTDRAARSNDGDALQISNVWSGPIIMLSNEQQAELDKHYLSYNSTISSESFDAIFGERKDCEL
ncbi:MAG: hypothetical protein JST01_18230 [Cyanobacteria bacterium SZAS TMP-1]|nr:hypothetical protein [Cyanobacteria bacterium SZAS TMP-1]